MFQEMMENENPADKGIKEKLLSNLIDKLLSMDDGKSAEEKGEGPEIELGSEDPAAEIKALSIEADPLDKKKLG